MSGTLKERKEAVMGRLEAEPKENAATPKMAKSLRNNNKINRKRPTKKSHRRPPWPSRVMNLAYSGRRPRWPG